MNGNPQAANKADSKLTLASDNVSCLLCACPVFKAEDRTCDKGFQVRLGAGGIQAIQSLIHDWAAKGAMEVRVEAFMSEGPNVEFTMHPMQDLREAIAEAQSRVST